MKQSKGGMTFGGTELI